MRSLNTTFKVLHYPVPISNCLITCFAGPSASSTAGYVGLAISYALGINSKLSGLVTAFTETEKELVAVERCFQYIEEVDIERDDHQGDRDEEWPHSGAITFENVSMQYRPHLPLALANFNLDVAPKEKLGIMGRTGSGKSSIFQCLLRTVDSLYRGQIKIDGRDIFAMSINELRSKIWIIPQEPFLFGGTIRENFVGESPIGDDVIWGRINQADLGEVVDGLGGLDAVLEECGKTLSTGQKQLFCVVRALLASTRVKIVCVDEATANVDANTDYLIKDILYRSLPDHTVLTIAHRLDTVCSASSRLIVVSEGEIVESLTPEQFKESPKSFDVKQFKAKSKKK